ncbi:MAG TPA: ATP-dependent DNA ligase, partial [Gemmatimonadaceae bacterium]|nr:ATP-dependent DNA ligase [Gemmatimonadaceae bacterium]
KLEELVLVSAAVAATSGRLDKISKLAALLTRVSPEEVPIAIGFLIGWPRQGRIGVGWATVSAARESSPAATASLELGDVDKVLDLLTAARGKNSAAARARLLRDLFSLATRDEQNFLGNLLIGEVRQGALEGVLLEAIAKAASLPADRVRRATMMTGDLGTVARAALGENRETALAEYQLQIFRPVQPMLADSAPTVAEALSAGVPAAVEWKLDGARIQVHRKDDRVAVYTRNLNEVTGAVPEVVEAVSALPGRELILDGEVIALAADGRPLSFQDTMRRFGRRLEILKLREELPLTPFFFDVLLQDGETLVDQPLSARLERLETFVPEALRVPRIVTESPDEASKFQKDALARGHEGVMVKLMSAPYAAGRRGSAWIKVKEARTLDLVVLAVEWGSGRRKGWLSNIHLGARDPVTGGFVMLGKTFKGMTDEILEWQTKEFLARETHRDGHIVYVRPELVVEVAFNEVQRSSQYSGGVTLRFARVKGYRPDKKASEADTIDAVRAFLPTG